MRALFARQYRWQCWLDVEAALAAAEAEYGIIPVAAAEAIASAARLAGLDVARIQRGIAETSHPLMALVTELAMAAGEHGGWVHWGATTQNITQTGDVLVLREAHRKILRLLAGVLSAAADLAERTAGMLAAGRTHGQHAVPITFGFKPAGWIDELVRHVTRLRSAEGRVFTAMTGGAVGNFASLGRAGPPVQDAVAARLDLVPMAVPSRAIVDSFAEYVCLLGLLGATGTRIALEVFQLMKTELAEASEPAPPGTVGSSTMPHKRNPQLSDDCITIGAQLRALVPLALEGMLHDHEVDGAHSAMLDDALERACVLAGDLLVRLEVIVSGLEVDPARMRANLALSGGMISSEAVMLGLGQAIGRQTAHEVVYDAARGESTTFAAALKHDPRVTAHLDAAAIDRLLDPAGHTGMSEGHRPRGRPAGPLHSARHHRGLVASSRSPAAGPSASHSASWPGRRLHRSPDTFPAHGHPDPPHRQVPGDPSNAAAPGVRTPRHLGAGASLLNPRARCPGAGRAGSRVSRAGRLPARPVRRRWRPGGPGSERRPGSRAGPVPGSRPARGGRPPARLRSARSRRAHASAAAILARSSCSAITLSRAVWMSARIAGTGSLLVQVREGVFQSAVVVGQLVGGQRVQGVLGRVYFWSLA